MDKEDKQIIDRATKEEWRIGDRTRLKRLLEKNLKLYRENVELEQRLEQTEKDLADYQFNYPKIKELEKDIEYLKACKQKIIDLQKENTELKKEVLEVRQHLELTEREWGKDTVKLCLFKTQLTKAKELLELFVQWNYGCCKEPDYKDLVKQAEQFLKEVEK